MCVVAVLWMSALCWWRCGAVPSAFVGAEATSRCATRRHVAVSTGGARALDAGPAHTCAPRAAHVTVP